MSNAVDLIAENSDDLLNAGMYGAGAIIRVQDGTAVTQPGDFADLAGTGSTPTIALVAGDRTYTAFDPGGTSTTWYRSRYENAGGTIVSDWSASFQVGSVDRLCSVGQVKARITLAGPTDTNDDELIDELIVGVSDWIEDYTHRRLVPVASTVYTFDTRAGYVLHLPLGVRAVSLLEVNNLNHQPPTGGTYTTVAATDYNLWPHDADNTIGWPYTELRISRAAVGSIWRFATIENGARVTATWGFASTPPAIQAVAIDAVVAAYQNRKNGASGVIGAEDSTIPPWSLFFGRGSPQRATLDRYRHLPV